MPKLYDEVKGTRIQQLEDGTLVPVTVPENVPVFECTPLYQFLCETLPEADFEKLCYAPPFPDFFVEYETDAGAVGALVRVEDPEEFVTHYDLTTLPSAYSDMHWGIVFQLFVQGDPLSGRFLMVVLVDKQGIPLSAVQPIALYERISDEVWERVYVEENLKRCENLMSFLYPVATSIAYLRDERNLEERVPNRATRRRAEREGTTPYTYHILKVKAFEEFRKKYAFHGGGSHVAPRLHEVRANWAYYAPDKPLFGKVVGMVWRTSHLRGNPDRGVVEKEYHVDAPRKAASACSEQEYAHKQSA